MKNKTNVEKLVKKSIELFPDKILSEFSPEEYAKILEENLKEENKKKSKKVKSFSGTG